MEEEERSVVSRAKGKGLECGGERRGLDYLAAPTRGRNARALAVKIMWAYATFLYPYQYRDC